MQSMDEIYQKYAKTVYRYLISMTQSDEIAEELTQETFYQAIKCIHKYDGSSKITTWLCAIAKNQYLAYLRKHPKMDEIQEDHGNPLPSAEDDVLSADRRVAYMKLLHLCPEPFKEVLYLRIFCTLSFKEIGEIMGKTENWARVTYYRGKEKLRKDMNENES